MSDYRVTCGADGRYPGDKCELAPGHPGDHRDCGVSWERSMPSPCPHGVAPEHCAACSPDPIAAAIPLAPVALTEARVREIVREELRRAFANEGIGRCR